MPDAKTPGLGGRYSRDPKTGQLTQTRKPTAPAGSSAAVKPSQPAAPAKPADQPSDSGAGVEKGK